MSWIKTLLAKRNSKNERMGMDAYKAVVRRARGGCSEADLIKDLQALNILVEVMDTAIKDFRQMQSERRVHKLIQDHNKLASAT